MNDIFCKEQQSNYFDNLVVDVEKLFTEHPVEEKSKAPVAVSPFAKLYQSSIIPLKYRRHFFRLLRQANIDTAWLQEFNKYWTSVLHGRPLHSVHDFFFLKNLYRIKFQASQIPDTQSASVHLQAWQRPELIYQLFHLVAKESLGTQTAVIDHLIRLKNKPRVLLEFGCATAPITTSLFEFCPRLTKKSTVYISDLQTVAFHYAAYKFKHVPNVVPLPLMPANDFQLTVNKTFDAIFCITVFEHLNKPFETVKSFHNLLCPGGLLFFDYIKGEGEGMDTGHGVRERGNTLDFIGGNFEVIYGTIEKNKNMGLTIAMKNGR